MSSITAVDLVLSVLFTSASHLGRTSAGWPKLPPTDSIVNGDAVGASRMASSSCVKYFGNRKVRAGIKRRIMIGKPMAAIVCVIAKVAPNPTSSRATKYQRAFLRLRRVRGSDAGVRDLSRQR